MTRLLLVILLFVPTASGSLAQAGTITGRLLDLDGKPASRVRVGALDAPEGATGADLALLSVAQTDSDGRFRLEDVPPGRYYISAGPLTTPTYYPGVARRALAVPIIVAPNGRPVEGIDFRLVIPPVLKVSGRVTAAPRGSSPGNVRLDPGLGNFSIGPVGGAGNAALVAAIAPDGSFEFKDVPPGQYLATTSGMDSMPLVFTLLDEDVTGLMVRARIQASGTVAMQDGGPLPPFRVVFTDTESTSSAAAPVTVAASKSFTTELGAGEYRVTALGLPPGLVVKSMTKGNTNLLTQTTVLDPDVPTVIQVTLGIDSKSRWVELRGHFTGRASQPREVTAAGPTLQEIVRTPIRPDGSFQFPKLLPGSYTLNVAPELVPLSPVMTINLGNADVTDVELTVPPTKDVKGQFLLEGGSLMPVTVMFSLAWKFEPAFGSSTSSAAPAVKTAITTSISVPVRLDGSFTITLPEGESRLTLQTDLIPKLYTLRDFRYGSTDLVNEPVRIAATDSAELQIRLNTDAGLVRVSGRVMNAGTAGGRMVISVSSPVQAVQAAIKPDGTFELPGLAPGAYPVHIITSSLFPAEVQIAVPAGGLNDVAIALPPISRVSIHASVEDGGPPPPFVLRMQGTRAAGIPSRGPETVSFGALSIEFFGFSADVTPLADGTCSLILPEGEYYLGIGIPDSAPDYTVKSVVHDGKDLQQNALKITSAESGTIEVVLVRGK